MKLQYGTHTHTHTHTQTNRMASDSLSQNSNDPCRQLTTSRSCGMCSLNCTKKGGGLLRRAFLQTQTRHYFNRLCLRRCYKLSLSVWRKSHKLSISPSIKIDIFRTQLHVHVYAVCNSGSMLGLGAQIVYI